jgi:hypothetical protein
MLGFIAFVTIVLGFVVLMVFSSMFHDISSIDEVLPTFAKENNSYSVGDVQPLHETRSEVEILATNGDVDGVDEHHVVETHLENLWK